MTGLQSNKLVLCCSLVFHPWDGEEPPVRRRSKLAIDRRQALKFLRSYVALAAALLAIAFIAFTILWFVVDLLGG